MKVTLPAAMDYTDVQRKAEYDTAFEERSETRIDSEERVLRRFWPNITAKIKTANRLK